MESELVPLIVGGWLLTLAQMGVHRMKQHWRYLIARYGAYPVLWSVGGEVFDPPAHIADQLAEPWRSTVVVRGWTEVARYVREIDPYHHPITAHELPPPLDVPLQDRSITDFDLLQSSQFGWPSLALSVAQLNSRYSRPDIQRPVVQGEIGYENHFSRHFDVYQRAAFWISMMNGAAGHTYGADATWGAYSNAKELPGSPLSFLNWEQGMQLPGSYQVGLGSKLLRQYEWWRLEPHPEWVAPRGRTFFDSHHEFAVESWTSWWLEKKFDHGFSHWETKFPGEGWVERYGSVDRPYAAGIARELRIIYVPVRRDSPLPEATPPTVLGLEWGVRYHAYLWEAALGIRFDLGSVERPPMGEIIFEDRFCDAARKAWSCYARRRLVPHERTQEDDEVISILEGIAESNLVAEVEISGQSRAGLIVRHQSEGTYVVAIYSSEDGALYLKECSNHVDSPRLGMTSISKVGGTVRLSLEVRENMAAASLSDGERSYTTPIVQLSNTSSGSAGFFHGNKIESKGHACERFTLRRSPCLREDESLPAKLYDAAGRFRGELDSWRTQGKSKHIILDAYRPAKLPGPCDWILVLDATRTNKSVCPA